MQDLALAATGWNKQDQQRKTGKWGAGGGASAEAGCDKEATLGWRQARLSRLECLAVGLQVEAKLRWIGA